MIEEKGSFRDPAGKIFYHKNKVYRKLSNLGKERLKFILEENILEESIKNSFIINSKIVKIENELNTKNEDIIFEHQKIPFISYPYEWTFSQLKTAAIHHIDFHLFLLERNATLIDASAYNIQFNGSQPIFIDLLSLKKYEEGEFWTGHKQFCENFLNPLVLKSKKGISFNNWFRGNLEGIHTSDLNNILSFFDKLSYNIFVHVFLLNQLELKSNKNKSLKVKVNKNKFPKKNFVSMLKQLKNYIFSLKDRKNLTTWQNYSTENTYKNKEENEKIKIVKNFCLNNKMNNLLDLGCNDGVYSKCALSSGCNYVVGFDFDTNAIDRAFQNSVKNKLNFLPLYFDASNPSSNLGWDDTERKSLKERANFDGIIALAFEHHLTIAKNIPLESVIKWIMFLAPKGLIEFVPKNDKTIQKMLEIKGDIFLDYNKENFEKYILKFGKIIKKDVISESGRTIYEFQR